MIDTLKIKLKSSDIGHYVDLMEEVGSKINVDIKKSNEFRIIGTLKNLKIYIERSYITIEGSLPKYYYGSNLNTLSRDGFRLAIEQLSRELDLPLSEANITRIDLAGNIEVENAPRNYYPSFGILNKFDRIVRRGTLYYEQVWCKLCFYDKIAEAEKHNDPHLTEELLQKNILRYEIRYLHKWLQYYFKREIKVKEIYHENSDVRFGLLAEWFGKYDDIIKTKVMKPEFDMTVKDFSTWCVKYVSQRQDIFKLIDACGEKRDRRKARLKREILKILGEDSGMESLMVELNSKIEEHTEEIYAMNI